VFTGIIEVIGTVTHTEDMGGDRRLSVFAPELDWADVKLGDSIATNGVCLTVIRLGDQSFEADASIETLEVTQVGKWQNGFKVNLEKALLPSTRLGGHLVSGHVDGIGEVISRIVDARSVRFTIRAPDELARYVAQKGSITIDGVSLTVNSIVGTEFDINIVPHTLNNTIINQYQVGTRVHLEVDLVARYLERLLMGESAAEKGRELSESFLATHGYLQK